MSERRLRIVMNGITGRMGMNQHLIRSILAIRDDGGLPLSGGVTIVPEPILVGRNRDKLQRLAKRYNVQNWTTDLDAALSDDHAPIYFDGGSTLQRPENLKMAIRAGKHVYCEKPTSTNFGEAFELHRLATAKGRKSGVVHDKLWAPGMQKLQMLRDSGFFGRVLSVRIEGCYWVFEGDLVTPQRPSWNYRKEDGGGMILDMMPHYQYMIELFGMIERVVCLGATHIPRRWDENGQPFAATADDAAYAIAELDNGVIAQINSSWCYRVSRNDILTVLVDGTEGSAVADLRSCRVQRRETTPRSQWSLNVAEPIDHAAAWQEVPDQESYKHAFRAEWELFIQHVIEDTPFPWTLLSGARGVQFAEASIQSWKEAAWKEVLMPEG